MMTDDDDNTSTGASASASSRRVRTGCSTCRLRKVKCDEAKPSCLRCKDGGRDCGGYPPIPLRAKRKDAGKPRGKHRNSTGAASSIDDANAGCISGGSGSGSGAPMVAGQFTELSDQISQPEYSILTHFRETVAVCFQSTIDRVFWGELLLQIGTTEPAVLYALDAMAQVYLYVERGSADQRVSDAFILGLQQYNRAIQELQRRCSDRSHDSEAIFLLCSLIFSHIEALAERRRLALLHLQKGIQLLHSQLGHESCLSSPDSENEEGAGDGVIGDGVDGCGKVEGPGAGGSSAIVDSRLIRDFVLPLFRREAVSAVAQGYASPTLCLAKGSLLLSLTEAATPFTTFPDASRAISIVSGKVLVACAQVSHQDLLALRADTAGADGTDNGTKLPSAVGGVAAAMAAVAAKTTDMRLEEEEEVVAATAAAISEAEIYGEGTGGVGTMTVSTATSGPEPAVSTAMTAPMITQVDLEELDRSLKICSINFTSFESLALASLQPESTRDTVSLDKLRIYLLISQIMYLRVSNGMEMETGYDMALRGFSQLFGLVVGTMPHLAVAESPPDLADGDSTVAFRFQPGYLFPLWFIATKCRNRPLRRATLEAIERWPQREEGWDPVLTARAARCIIEEEDGAALEDRSSDEGLPPEQNRVHASRFEASRGNGGSKQVDVWMTKLTPCTSGQRWDLIHKSC